MEIGQKLFFDRGVEISLGQRIGYYDEIQRVKTGYAVKKNRNGDGDYYNVFPTLKQACHALGVTEEELLEAQTEGKSPAQSAIA